MNSDIEIAAEGSGAAEAPHVTTANRRDRGRLLHIGEVLILPLLVTGVIVFFGTYSTTRSTFLTQANLIAIAGNSTVVAIVALAVMVPLCLGLFDLAAGATTSLASVATAAAMSYHGQSLISAVLIGLAAGILVGAFNGIVIGYMEFSSIVATLGSATVITGFIQYYTEGVRITHGIDPGFLDLGSLLWFGMPRITVILIPTVVIVYFFLEHTPLGRNMRAVGSNASAAALVGLPVKRIKFLSFVISGALAGLAGVLLTARTGSGDGTTGPTMLFPALTAVFLGAISIKPGLVNSFGTVLGVFLVSLSVSGLTLMGAGSWASAVFNGCALLLATGLAAIAKRYRNVSAT